MHIRKEAFWYRALASLYLSDRNFTISGGVLIHHVFVFVGRADVPASVIIIFVSPFRQDKGRKDPIKQCLLKF